MACSYIVVFCPERGCSALKETEWLFLFSPGNSSPFSGPGVLFLPEGSVVIFAKETQWLILALSLILWVCFFKGAEFYPQSFAHSQPFYHCIRCGHLGWVLANGLRFLRKIWPGASFLNMTCPFATTVLASENLEPSQVLTCEHSQVPGQFRFEHIQIKWDRPVLRFFDPSLELMKPRHFAKDAALSVCSSAVVRGKRISWVGAHDQRALLWNGNTEK